MAMERMNYKELLAFGTQQLEKAGIEEASLDARLLLEEVCGKNRSYLLAHGGELAEEGYCRAYADLIGQRAQHIPLQHLLGYQEFMGLRFQVSGDVLIPRQDTETLVEEVLRYLHDGMRILDMCTGSGCILLSLLHYSNHCIGVGSDLSKRALQLAEKNAKALQLEAEFIQGDLFENISGRYEIIVSNPPYIPTAEIEGLMEEVRDHDPRMALDGGRDGLAFYRRMIQEAKIFLYPGGMLFFEIGCNQADQVSRYLREAGYRDVTVCQDLSGLDRVVSGRLETVKNELA